MDDVQKKKKKPAPAAAQGHVRMLAGGEEILKDKKGSFSRQNSVPDFFKSSSGTRTSSSVLLEIADDDPDDPLEVQWEMPPL